MGPKKGWTMHCSSALLERSASFAAFVTASRVSCKSLSSASKGRPGSGRPDSGERGRPSLESVPRGKTKGSSPSAVLVMALARFLLTRTTWSAISAGLHLPSLTGWWKTDSSRRVSASENVPCPSRACLSPHQPSLPDAPNNLLENTPQFLSRSTSFPLSLV